MPKIKAIYIERSRLNGNRAAEIRMAQRMASKHAGYTKTKDYIVHRKTIEFPQETGFRSGGRVRFSQGGDLVQY